MTDRIIYDFMDSEEYIYDDGSEDELAVMLGFDDINIVEEEFDSFDEDEVESNYFEV